MSDLSYFRNVIDVSDFTSISGDFFFKLWAPSVDATYIPRETDIITVSPKSSTANVRCWVEFVAGGNPYWKIYVSDRTYVGKIYYRLKSRSY